MESMTCTRKWRRLRDRRSSFKIHVLKRGITAIRSANKAKKVQKDRNVFDFELLPKDLRLVIYDEMEPWIEVRPDYCDWELNVFSGTEKPYAKHPMLGLSKAIDREINGRYFNQDKIDSPPFLPSRTLFIEAQIPPTGIRAANRRNFFRNSDSNIYGIKHVRVEMKNYLGTWVGQEEYFNKLLGRMEKYPRLKTLDLELIQSDLNYYENWFPGALKKNADELSCIYAKNFKREFLEYKEKENRLSRAVLTIREKGTCLPCYWYTRDLAAASETLVVTENT